VGGGTCDAPGLLSGPQNSLAGHAECRARPRSGEPGWAKLHSMAGSSHLPPSPSITEAGLGTHTTALMTLSMQEASGRCAGHGLCWQLEPSPQVPQAPWSC
jgi:hypothetical protein